MRVLIAGYVPAEGRFSMVRAARAVQRSVQPLLASGEKVTLAERPGEAMAETLETRRWRVKLAKRAGHPLRLALGGYDVLHVIDNDYASAVPPRKRGRTVVTCHDMMPFWIHKRIEDGFHGRLGLRFFRKALRVMAQCGHVACDSAFTRAAVLEHTACAPDRVSVIPLGVDAVFRPLAPEDPGLTAFRKAHGLEGRHVLLHVGSTDAYKNVEGVFAVVAALVADSNGILLKVGGRFSPEQEALLARLKLGKHVIHLRGLDEADLCRAYNAADCLLWPSHFEGFGLPVAEAMACGTPVVCSTGGSLPEVAGDGAALYSPEDTEGLAAACRRVLEDRAYAETLRTKGFTQAARFTWENTAAAYLALYRTLYA